ncbi:MAG: NAD(P)H-hydrate dehydratase [Coriobacteriales bacterium]|nr:NAD(P)H-hydrate dehydratase [Coriobacteriales bacterium]
MQIPQAPPSQNLGSLLSPIPLDAHKYTRGSLLVCAGSARFPGAAILAAKAAARAGAGYVTLAIPEPVVMVAQTHLLSIPVLAAPAANGVFAADAWEVIGAHTGHLDAIVLGPGLTVTPSTSAFVQTILRETGVPLLLDADALNILSALAQQGFRPVTSNRALLLTPHAGELARLYEATGTSNPQQLAEALQAIVVAKGPETHIVSTTRAHRSTAGTPALAKAGTGDVLAGVIGSFIAQSIAPFEAALLGVELHGRAGQLAEERLGRRAVCAEDLLETLPLALSRLADFKVEYR